MVTLKHLLTKKESIKIAERILKNRETKKRRFKMKEKEKKSKILVNKLDKISKEILNLYPHIKSITIISLDKSNRNNGFTITRKSKINKRI